MGGRNWRRTIIWIVVISLISGGVWWISPKEPKYVQMENLLTEALACAKTNDIDEAASLCQEAKYIIPSDPMPYATLASIYIEAEKFDKAHNVINDADARFPSDVYEEYFEDLLEELTQAELARTMGGTVVSADEYGDFLGYTYAEYNGHQYVFFSISHENYDEMRAYCYSIGGYPAVITSDEENRFLYQQMKEQGFADAYFGYSDAEEEGTWVWDTGEETAFVNWASGEPNNDGEEDYGMFYSKADAATWNDGGMGDKTNANTAFICEWNGVDTMIIPEGLITPEPTEEPEPTEKPKATATPKPTEEAKATSTPKPTKKPKATSTPKPTATPKPTSTPTPKPTATPTPMPSEVSYKVSGDTLTFSGGGKITKKTLPENMDGIKKIVVGEWITAIDERVFEATPITSVEIKGHVKTIGYRAFASCVKLESIVIKPESGTELTINNSVFLGCKNLTSVTLGEGVISIGEYSFNSCENLQSIELPRSLKTIGKEAFVGCSVLKEVKMKEGTVTIGASAFQNCESLKTVTFPSTLEEIGRYAFSGTAIQKVEIKGAIKVLRDHVFTSCIKLESATVQPDMEVTLETAVFENCKKLTTVTLGEGVTAIGNYTFNKCEMLQSITIPKGTKTIGEYAFANCTSLVSATIKEGLTTIYKEAFRGCTSLATVTFPASLTNIERYAFENTAITSVKLEGKIKKVADHAFMNCPNLKTIVVKPEMEAVLETGAFESCGSLKNVTLGEGITSIGGYVFYKCSGLETIEIPKGVKTLGEHAFHYCDMLRSVSIASGMTTIGQEAFRDCTSLGKVTLPSTITEIAKSAFYGSGIGSLKLEGKIKTVGSYAFANCSNLETVVIKPEMEATINNNAFESSGVVTVTLGSGVSSIGNYAFNNCVSLTNVQIPGSAGTICEGAFQGCELLEEAKLGDGVKTIGVKAFYKCSNLSTVNIPATVTTIGKYAFAYSGINSIKIIGNINSIGERAFEGCMSLSELEIIPGMEASIGNHAFRDCMCLYQLNLGDGVTGIGACAFANNICLDVVTLPGSIKTVGDNAFEGCSGLSSMTFSEGTNTIGSYVFKSCANLQEIHFPSSVTSIGKGLLQDASDFVMIFCKDGSPAHTYAVNNDLVYISE